MPTLTKIYTMEEASEHNTKDDCWVVVDGKLDCDCYVHCTEQITVRFYLVGELVYDVSSYLDEHPGGDDVLLRATGRLWNNNNWFFHFFILILKEKMLLMNSKMLAIAKQRGSLWSNCIGELDQTPPPIPELEIVSKKQDLKGLPQKVLDLSKQYWVVPVTAVGLSVVVGFLYLKKK
ncbi:cytochrome isoform A [Sesamum angolense]|uniref:Cytochrome isoform A n=1 Tax=Sesamum angolense TaxID=2727404 RepID=A0AAE2BW32_9LAMI|nr:cytochrome isoform A [Sesamum angolense]